MPKSREEEEIDVLSVIRKEIKSVEHSLEKIDDIYRKDLRKLDRFADKIAQIGGSWQFIGLFIVFLILWLILNTSTVTTEPLDPYPYDLLNLILAIITSMLAPIILMSQNRGTKHEKVRLEMDLEKDLRDLHLDESSHHLLLELRRDVQKIKQRLKIR